MAKRRRKRRTRTEHTGVKLLQRERASGTVWLARWTDPDTGKAKEASLTALGRTTHEARREWAIKRSQTLAARRAAIAAGAQLRTETLVTDAVKRWYEANPRLREGTVEAYRLGSDAFVSWAEAQGLRFVEDLRPPHLASFRDHMGTLPRCGLLKGGKRGEHAASSEPLSPVSVNSRLRPVKTLLRYLLRRGLTPELTRDAIQDSLHAFQEPRPRPTCMRPAELKRLVQALERHDCDKHSLTREEKARGLRKGNTLKHDPIAPFVLVVLLSGMRLGEVLGLRRAAVDLDAAPAGEVVLRVGEVKTHHERAVDLSVSPALRRLLRELVLKAGDRPYLFGGAKPWPRSRVEAARRRLVRDYGAPEFTWQGLRSTCGSFLTNAPGIFGAASAYRSAKQLGHSVQVAEKHYTGLVRGIPHKATDLETAMQVAKLLKALAAEPKARGRPKRA
ncbi:MAG: tyrosine-type recombinase/integrase [Planctomycetota bacterium]